MTLPPKFMEVAGIWYTLQDHMVLLSSYNDVLQNLKSFFIGFDQKTNVLENVVESLNARKRRKELIIKQENIDGSEEILEESHINRSKIVHCRVVHSDMGANNLEEKPQFLGCCTLRLIEGNGVLLPGDPKIGMLKFGMLNYSFATCKSAYKFDKHPEMYLKKLFYLVRRMPELISLLGMNDAINRYIYMKELKKQTDEEIVNMDSETQTDIHPIENYIDPSYSWDLWELKRRAVQLANISKRKSHSTQTFKSHMRMSVGTQTYSLKETSTQTKNDNTSGMPKLSTFIFGLRGRDDNLAHTAVLTRPHDEWLHEPGARILSDKDENDSVK